MPPPNTTPATAILMTALPYTNVQTGIHDAGTTFTVWYRYVAAPGEEVVGFMFYGDAVTYRPTVTAYMDDEFYVLGGMGNNEMTQIPVLTGRTYLWEIVPNAGNPNPATLNVSVLKAQVNTNAQDSILIRSASILSAFQDKGYIGLPAGYINPTTGIITRFIPQIPCGEAGDYLPTGEILFEDEFTDPFNHLLIYNSSMSLQKTVSWARVDFSGHAIIRTWREQNKWLIVCKGSAPEQVRFFWMDADGTKTDMTLTTAGTQGCTAAATSPAGDYVYIAGVGVAAGAAIKKWDVAAGVFVADFAAGVANHIVQDILVMSNGDVIAIYHRSSTDEIFVRVYNSSGTVLRTWTAPVINYSTVAPRLGYANDADISFWVFLHNSANLDGMSRFVKVAVADVSEIISFTTPSSAYMDGDRGPTPAFRFVTSDSCPMLLALGASVNYPGIYVIEPNKPNDTVNNGGTLLDVAIPDPTFKTALLG